MKQTIGFILKSKLTVPLAVAVVASTSLLAVSHYKIGQTASVVSASCYFQTEIDQMSADKAVLEGEVSDLNNKLIQVNQDIITNSENITNTNTQIESLTKDLVSDYTIEQKKGAVDKVYKELGDRKSIDALKIEFQEKQKEYIAMEDKLKVVNSSLIDNGNALTTLKSQVTAKQMLENQLKLIDPLSRNMSLLLTQMKNLQALEAKELSLNRAKSTLASATPKSIGAATQVYKTALTVYNTELTKYKSTYKNIYTIPAVKPYKELVLIYNSAKKDYDAKKLNYTKVKVAYEKMYKSNNTLSSIALSDLAVATSRKVSRLMTTQRSLSTAFTQSKTDIDTLKTNFTTVVSQYQVEYGYTSTIPEIAVVQVKYDKVLGEYDGLIAKNNKINEEIEKLNSDLVAYNNEINDITGRINMMQTGLSEKNSLINDHSNAITNAGYNICPTSELACNNALDDDRDGTQDCNDSDCSATSGCQVGPVDVGTTDVVTVVSSESMCGNGQDDDMDGAIDCNDSDCAGNSSCTGQVNTGTDVVTISQSEVCNNSVDDDANGLIDCADSACVNDSVCKSSSSEICDDGIDNNLNGTTDCGDLACTSVEFCQKKCEVIGITGASMGTCSDLGLSPDGEVLSGGAKNNGGADDYVNNPNDCPKGTVANKIGSVTVGGVTKIFYKCVEGDSDNDNVCDASERLSACANVDDGKISCPGGNPILNAIDNLFGTSVAGPSHDFDTSYRPPLGTKSIKCGDCECIISDETIKKYEAGGADFNNGIGFSKSFSY